MKQENPVIVIVGGGFAGLHAVKILRDESVKLVLVDKNNYHLFQPLLYQVATAGLGPEDISYPLRAVLQRQHNAVFHMAEAVAVNFGEKQVITTSGKVAYDYLLLAVGAVTNFFGIESVAKNAFGLKNLEDALKLRNHILSMCERILMGWGCLWLMVVKYQLRHWYGVRECEPHLSLRNLKAKPTGWVGRWFQTHYSFLGILRFL